MKSRRKTLSAVMIAPDRALAAQFCASTAELDAFDISLDLKSYPSGQTLEIRARQLEPDVFLLDVASDLHSAIEIISHLCRADAQVTVIALDRQGGSETILKVLRAGASEFLYAPFDTACTSEAVARVLRLRKTQPQEMELGSVCVFSSVKPGSGASTLAAQTAFALKRVTSQRVLLADFDLMGGTIGFYLKLNHPLSVVNALQGARDLNRVTWSSLVTVSGGLDILGAPLVPHSGNIEADAVQGVLDYARTAYDWIILDLPVIFQRTSLVALPHADRTFLVSTSELASLNLARKSISMLDQLGFPSDRFQVVVNRVSRRDGISRADIEKLFRCPVHASFPNDYFSLHRVMTLGQPLSAEGDLGKAIHAFAGQLARASVPAGQQPDAAVRDVN